MFEFAFEGVLFEFAFRRPAFAPLFAFADTKRHQQLPTIYIFIFISSCYPFFGFFARSRAPTGEIAIEGAKDEFAVRRPALAPSFAHADTKRHLKLLPEAGMLV